eukprot:3708651-Rhodomonas_salina.2
MCASKQFQTLEEQAPSISKSDLWDPSISDAVLQQNYDALLNVNEAGDTVPEPCASNDEDMDSTPFTDSLNPPTFPVYDETETASVRVSPSGQTVTQIRRANKRRSATGGKRAITRVMKRQCTDQGAKATSVNSANDDDEHDWDSCADTQISDVSDHDLSEYLVGTSATFKLPRDYYPNDDGEWTVEVLDAKHDKGVSVLQCMMINGPVLREIGALIQLKVSPTSGNDYSACRALREMFPKAETPLDIYKCQPHYVRVFSTTVNSQSASQPPMPNGKRKATTVNKPSLAFAALVAVQTLAWAAATATVKGMTSPIPVQPRSQCDAQSRLDWERWLRAEEIEMSTCYEKGTFDIVDLPPGVVELPSMFQYKLKTGPNCEFVKCKTLLCTRGNLQFDSEFGETFAPTSSFAVIRLIISIAAQARLTLFQFDIRGAFLCAEIDSDIYLKLPPGYEPPPGKTAKLHRSLYGLKQAPSAFHALFEKWLLDHGFTPIGGDRVTFMLRRDISILSIYVDDGIAATNDEKLYKSFLAELAKDFELSDQGAIKWYLGVQINQNKPNGRISMSQAQYVKDILARFGMTGATPCLTPLEPNAHLTRADCPDKAHVDKAFRREYQRIVGSLMYLASFTRPDICHAVNQCSRFMSNPGPSHMNAARRIMRYLAGTIDHELTY